MRELCIAVALGSVGASCGFITAGAASAASDDSSPSDAPAAITGFAVEDAKTEPAQIRFVLADADADSVEVELRYDVDPDGSGPQPMVSGKVQHLFEPRPPPPANPPPASAPLRNPLVLAASPQGTEHVFDWYFTREAGIEDATYNEHVFVSAQVTGGAQSLTPGANAALLGVGNDPPAIVADGDGFADAEIPSGEVVGLARVTFLVADSSLDQVDVDVEYALADGLDVDAGELPGASSFQPATPDGQPPMAIQTTEGGTSVDFFWNPVADLGRTEHDVVFRITPSDRDEQGDTVATGAAVLTRRFRIDNNAAPIVQLQNDAVIANSDERRGIPIPFRVIDEEEDLVEVICQWRREGEAFPELPSDTSELDAILTDPEQRRAHRICTPYPRYAQGRVSPIDATSVSLPELASSESWILASGLEGKTLELLRPSSLTASLTSTWNSNPLVSPVAALPLGDGLTALVLDAPGSARLREIRLATGAVVREIATLGRGLPSAMALERGGEEAVLVALDDAGVWRLARVELESGAVSELAVSDGAEPAPVRGIASLGTHAAVFTVGSSLFFCSWDESLGPRLGPLSTGLATPWGVVVDPLALGRLYVSERDANRVLVVDLNSHGRLPVVVHSAPLQLGSFETPEALSLERSGSRLLVATGGQRRIEGLNLGAADGNVSFGVGAPVTGDITSLACGPDELRLACIPAAHELLVAGGVEQRRTIIAYESFDAGEQSGQRAILDAAPEPPAHPGQGWRVSHERVRGSAGGRAASFVWSSGVDVPDAGPVFLRALARDDELGPAAEGSASKTLRPDLRAGLGVESLKLGSFHNSPRPTSVATADFDGDGDVDLVTTDESSSRLAVFFQVSPRSFTSQPLVLGGNGPPMVRPRSVAAADLDCDGDIDIVSANEGSRNLTVFFQTSPGSFATEPLVLGDASIDERPVSVAAADLDGDGDIDLVCAHQGSNSNLGIYFQISPGSFATRPHSLGGPLVTDFPGSVAAADLDDDGDFDLVSANQGESKNLTVFFQTSSGSFEPRPLVLGGPSITDAPTSVAAADLNGDGDIDIITTNTGGGNLAVFFQISPGNFTTQPLELGLLVGGLQPIVAGDLDGDGDIDIVSSDQIFVQESPGRFSAAPLVLSDPAAPLEILHHGTVVDVDGDGDLDLVSLVRDDSDSTVENLTVFFRASPGGFGFPTLEVFEYFVAAADLDGDGDCDVVSTGDSSDGLTVFFQTSPRSFEPQPIPAASSSSSVDVADLDGDGDPDLVYADRGGLSGDNSLRVALQTLPGSFEPQPLALDLPQISFPNSVAAADLDGNGDLDLVSANTRFSGGGDALTVFFQTSSGSFEPQPMLLGGPSIVNATSVAAADLDCDGDLDLVLADNGIQSDKDLTVLFQTSPGRFEPPLIELDLPGGSSPNSVTAADLDGDGDIDLVNSNQDSGGSDGNLTVFFQTSAGSFAPQPLVLDLPGGSPPNSVTAADLDGDGDIDLVSSNQDSDGSGDGNLTVFFQTSAGSFAPQPLVLDHPQFTIPFLVSAADLDGDGDIDLIAGNTVFWGGR